MEKGAREQFATKFGCPADRVTATRRTDLDPGAAKPDHEVFELSGCEHALPLLDLLQRESVIACGVAASANTVPSPA